MVVGGPYEVAGRQAVHPQLRGGVIGCLAVLVYFCDKDFLAGPPDQVIVRVVILGPVARRPVDDVDVVFPGAQGMDVRPVIDPLPRLAAHMARAVPDLAGCPVDALAVEFGVVLVRRLGVCLLPGEPVYFDRVGLTDPQLADRIVRRRAGLDVGLCAWLV